MTKSTLVHMVCLFIMVTTSLNAPHASEVIGGPDTIISAVQKQTSCGDPEYTLDMLRQKQESYTRLNQTGNKLLWTGIPMTVLGLAAYVGGIILTTNNQPEVGGVLGWCGAISVSLGPEIWIAGGVIRIISKPKLREYDKRIRMAEEICTEH